MSAADPETVDLVRALTVLQARLPVVCTYVMTGDARSSWWTELAELLEYASKLCRYEADLTDPAASAG